MAKIDFKRIFSLKPPLVVGIDIGSTSVKLLELGRSGSSYRVESYAMEPLPDKAVEDKNIVDLEVVGEAIQRVVKRASPKAEYAAVAVAGPAVITKVVTMDAGMPDADIKSDLEGGNYIDIPPEELNLDFEIIGPNEKEPDTRTDVLMVASRSEIVESRTTCLEMAGLKTRIIDIEKYVLENAFKLIVENDPTMDTADTIALVEVGATTTTINVMGELEIVFTREELFGGKRLTEEIQNLYSLSYEEANLAKRTGGLPEDYEESILEPFRDDLAQQISRMVQYYYSMEVSSKYPKLSHILIGGGCASIPGIVEKVSNKVGGHVSIANPFTAMAPPASKVDKKLLMNDAPALIIACGLALRNFDAEFAAQKAKANKTNKSDKNK